MPRISGEPVVALDRLRIVPYVWPEALPNPLWLSPTLPTSEVRAAFIRRRRWQLLQERARDRAESPDVAATAFLLRWLTPVQEAEFHRTGGFMVQSSFGGQYWLQQDEGAYEHRVLRVAGRPLVVVRALCIQLEWDAPAADHLLAIKLLLENDVSTFLDVADEVSPDTVRLPWRRKWDGSCSWPVEGRSDAPPSR